MENPFELVDERLENIEYAMLKIIDMLNGLTQQENHHVPEADIMFDMKGLAEYLGCVPSTIQRYKNNKVFPYYQVGRKVKFKKSEVDQAMSSQRGRSSKIRTT